MRQSMLELHFEEDTMTVLMTDQIQFEKAFQELTILPKNSLVEAHGRLPEQICQKYWRLALTLQEPKSKSGMSKRGNMII